MTASDAMETDNGSGRQRRKKGSIPPMIGLADALDVVKEFYKRGGEGNMAVFAEITNNSATSSVLLKKTIALKRYGFIVDDDETELFRLTDRGRVIAKPRNAQEYQSAVQKAFLNIPTYQILYDRYKGNPLPQEMFMINTVADSVPEELAADWLRSFKEAAITAELLVTQEDGVAVLLDDAERNPDVLPKQVAILPPSPPSPPKEDSGKQQRISQFADEDQMQKESIPVGLGRRFYFWLPPDYTQQELDKFLKVVGMTFSLDEVKQRD